MPNKDSLVEVYVCVKNEWIESYEDAIESFKGKETFVERAQEIPILSIYSNSKYEEIKVQGNLIPNTTIVSAKIDLDNLLGCACEKYAYDFKIHFEAEDGKLRKLPQQASPESKMKLGM